MHFCLFKTKTVQEHLLSYFNIIYYLVYCSDYRGVGDRKQITVNVFIFRRKMIFIKGAS